MMTGVVVYYQLNGIITVSCSIYLAPHFLSIQNIPFYFNKSGQTISKHEQCILCHQLKPQTAFKEMYWGAASLRLHL
jgi:hypothetical protein